MKMILNLKVILSRILLICFLSVPVLIHGQKVVDEGVIIMKITEVSAEGMPAEQLNQMKAMLTSTETQIHFNDKYNVVVTKTMGDMNNTIIIDEHESDKSEMYMDLMGQKIKVIIDKEEMAKSVEDQELKYDIRKVDGEPLDIMGYPCVRYDVYEMKSDGKEAVFMLSMWVTDKLNIKGNSMKMLPEDLKYDGAPMRIELNQQGMSMRMEVTEIKSKFDKAVMDFDKSQYVERKQDELLKSFGGQ